MLKIQLLVCNAVTEPLIEKVAALSSIIEEQYKKQTQYEELVPALEQQYRECNEILNVTKEELASKNAILESNQEELAVCRMELQSIKSAPSDIHKGNSIFAEVEDRRRGMLKKMADLQNNYQEIKQMYHNKEVEFNVFRSQYAAMFHKADNTANILEDKDKLLIVYKDRVAELENKLKEEQMKDKQKERKQSTGKDFSYLEILLVEKTKEIEELHKKLEHTSIQRILTANMEYTLKDELRHWKRKAFSYESELITLKSKLELKHINDEIKNCYLWEDKFDMNKDESSKNQNIMNDTIKIPERQISQKVIGHNVEEKINESINVSTDITANDMELTGIIPSIIHKDLPGKSTLNNISSMPLKSAILKPDQVIKHLESGYKEKEKKSLRFSPDTVDSVSQQVKKDLKITKKEYPIIYIATNKK
ncbi:protein Spindly isoform X2 [Cephus cinctus]|uniref:Protein Spindly isoform X2 n=1 Tax=Cephus cinctus TaxID=211228 RepID=A0AAJ7FRW2_CEPCN|nr:protein Spindly isoform X2 [Cephus cinctus]